MFEVLRVCLAPYPAQPILMPIATNWPFLTAILMDLGNDHWSSAPDTL
jgi:hypothetical protein